jgi:hypothetical protein
MNPRYLNVLRHFDELIKDFTSGTVNNGDSGNTHPSCGIYHLAIKCYHVEGGVFSSRWPRMRKRVSRMQLRWFTFIEDVRSMNTTVEL